MVHVLTLVACLALAAQSTSANRNQEDEDTIGKWVTAIAQTPKHIGDAEHPSVRYSHEAVTWHDKMIVTHGYFYDRSKNAPSWRDDTWSFSLTAPHTWTQLLPIGNGGTSAPWGRYGHAVALHGSDLYMHGGTDGGTRIHKEMGFKMNMEFDDLWRLSLVDMTWEQLVPKSAGHPYGPGRRYLHVSCAVGPHVWFYGGSNKSDLWAWHTQKDTWHQLVPKPGEVWPGRRQGHAIAALPEKDGFVVSGGTRWGFGTKALLDDMWLFRPLTKKWDQLHVRDPSPSPRLYHKIASVGGRVVMQGGSTSTPGMKCQSETWIYDPTTSQWEELEAAPVEVYHHTLVSHGPSNTVFLFGGHKCGADSPTNPAYLNSVYKLTLPAATDDHEL